MVKYNSSVFVDLKRFVILQVGLTSLWCDREGTKIEIYKKMKKAPIVFITDKNLIIPAAVSINSLLKNAPINTYIVYVLIDESVDNNSIALIKKIGEENKCKILFRKIEYLFDDIIIGEKNWSKANLYRLLLPTIFKEYNKIIYSDVDIIFRSDISYILDDYDVDSDYLIKASKTNIDSIHTDNINVNNAEYFCAGFMVMNLRMMREKNIEEKCKKCLERITEYKYMDQDILNVICKGRVSYISTYLFGMDQGTYESMLENKFKGLNEIEIKEGIKNGIIHYTGKFKPWNSSCYRNEFWWQYYVNSAIFDRHYYYNIQREIWNCNFLGIKQRIKLVIRYFIRRQSSVK